jgi:Protein of unknown function (DUF3489)
VINVMTEARSPVRRLKMKTFSIENDTSNITIHSSEEEARAVLNSERFSDEAALTTLATNWPAARLIGIWNSLPGVTPVSKFKDRKTAITRIWKALQSLGDAVQPEAAEPEVVPVTEVAEVAEVAPAVAGIVPESGATPQPAEPVTSVTPEADITAQVAPQTAHVASEEASARNEATPANDANAAATKNPREGSKTSQVIAMLKREGGTTLEEIMTAMGWQKHTTRALLSAGGSLTKKHGLTVTSEKIGDKRVYSIKA